LKRTGENHLLKEMVKMSELRRLPIVGLFDKIFPEKRAGDAADVHSVLSCLQCGPAFLDYHAQHTHEPIYIIHCDNTS
jgi:hypothetical protein